MGHMVSKLLRHLLLLTLSVLMLPANAGWEREWIDTFDGNGVNWNYWTAHIQANYNNEIQCYTDDDNSPQKNYDVSDGSLKIIARRGDVDCVGLNGLNKPWTSGRLVSKDKREFLYGRLEARIKFNTLAKGTWPAFWALEHRIAEQPIKGDNDTVNWPNPGAGEIDIWEWFSHRPDSYITNFFNASDCGEEYWHPYAGGETDVLQFHTYAMEWSEDKVSFLMDDNVVQSVDISSCPQYKEPMFVLINLAMGGNLGGNVAPDLSTATLEVDYIAHCTLSSNNNATSCDPQTPAAIDSDNDTVSDNLDKCPNTAAATQVDIDGCELADTNDSELTTPLEAAPISTRNLNHSLSIFSNELGNLNGVNFNPDWGQRTTVEIVQIEGDDVLRYRNLNYQGTAFEDNPQDISSFTHLHFDYWTQDSTTLSFFLISPGPKETGYSIDITRNSWQGVDVPLSYFTEVDLSELFQLKVEGNGTVYFDNIYFNTPADNDSPTVSAPPSNDNTAPQVALSIEQNGQATTSISSNAGPVTVTANVDDTAGNSYAYDWSASTVTGGQGDGNIFTFDPSPLNVGSYQVIVTATVTNANSADLSTQATFSFQISAATSTDNTATAVTANNTEGSGGSLYWLLVTIALSDILRRRSSQLKIAKA